MARNSIKRYFYQLLARYVAYYLPAGARVAEVGARSGLLQQALGSRAVVSVPSDDVSALREAPPDRVILNGVLHYAPDIQDLLDRLHAVCTDDTRVVIAYFSSAWKPLFGLASRLGVAETGASHNWLSPSDVKNLLELSGFEIVAASQRVLIPVYIPLVSEFVNRWIAPLPFFRLFAVANIAVARRRSARGTEPLSVSVVVAARNEKGNIQSMLDRIPQMSPSDEVIIVEGHSSDGTWDEIKRVVALMPDRRIRIYQQTGKGKGDAVRLGFAEARNDVLMILDADLSVPPEELPKFHRALSDGVGEFINGSRLVYPMEKNAMRFANMLGNKFFATAFSFLLGQPLKDTLCGTKVLRRSHYEAIARDRAYFGDFDPFGDFDLLFGAARQGLRIVELPIRYRERVYGDTNIRRWSHGVLLLRMTIFAARRMKFI